MLHDAEIMLIDIIGPYLIYEIEITDLQGKIQCVYSMHEPLLL